MRGRTARRGRRCGRRRGSGPGWRIERARIWGMSRPVDDSIIRDIERRRYYARNWENNGTAIGHRYVKDRNDRCCHGRYSNDGCRDDTDIACSRRRGPEVRETVGSGPANLEWRR